MGLLHMASAISFINNDCKMVGCGSSGGTAAVMVQQQHAGRPAGHTGVQPALLNLAGSPAPTLPHAPACPCLPPTDPRPHVHGGGRGHRVPGLEAARL
jgi:hypothetical protein